MKLHSANDLIVANNISAKKAFLLLYMTKNGFLGYDESWIPDDQHCYSLLQLREIKSRDPIINI